MRIQSAQAPLPLVLPLSRFTLSVNLQSSISGSSSFCFYPLVSVSLPLALASTCPVGSICLCLSLSISLTPRLPLCLCGPLFSLGEETLAGSPLLFSRICPHVWLNQACHSLWKSDRHFPLVFVDSHLGEGLGWRAVFCPGVMTATSHPAPSLTLDILSNSIESWSLPFHTISSVPFWLRAA